MSSDSEFGGTFLLLTSFAAGQKQAESLRAWMPERNRGDRKSQTRGKFSLFWVKCRGGRGCTSRGEGRGKPFPEEQPRRSGLYQGLLGTRNASSWMLKVRTLEMIRSWLPKPAGSFPRGAQRMVSQQLSDTEQSQQLVGPAAAISHCHTHEKIHAGHRRHHLPFGAGGRGQQPSRGGWGAWMLSSCGQSSL